MKKMMAAILFLAATTSTTSAQTIRVREHVLHDGIDPFTPWQIKIDWVGSPIPAPRLQCKKCNRRLFCM